MPGSPRATFWRMRVDPVACDGFGYCAELVPELLWLDEWGYPVLDDGDVPPHLRSLAEQAVRLCPRRALLLERVSTGRVSTGRPSTVRVPRAKSPRGSAPQEKAPPASTAHRPGGKVTKPRVAVIGGGARVVASNAPARRRVQYPAP